MMSRAGLPVVLVTGAPGTGKSTLGRRLAGRLGAALLDQDVATQPLVDVVQALIGCDDLDDARLRDLTRGPRYEVLAALAADNLEAGVPVVLVAPYTTERSDPLAWSALSARLRAAGGDPLLVWLSLPPDQQARRLRWRAAARDRHKLRELALPTAPPLPPVAMGRPAPGIPHLAVSADQPVEAMESAVLTAILSALD